MAGMVFGAEHQSDRGCRSAGDRGAGLVEHGCRGVGTPCRHSVQLHYSHPFGLVSTLGRGDQPSWRAES